MANTVSSLKRVRQTERSTDINRKNKSKLRTTVRTISRLITAKDGKAAEAALPVTFSTIDRAAKVGLIKKNTAARYKSKLHSKVKTLTGQTKK